MIRRAVACIFAMSLILLSPVSLFAEDQHRLDPRKASFAPPVFASEKPLDRALASGVRLFMREDHDIGLVRVYLSFAGGEVHDPQGKEGLADITQAVWRAGGTKTRGSEEFDEALEARGIELGISIGRESGQASLSVLSRDLDVGLDLLAEILMTPAFSPDRFDWAVKEKKDSIRREEDDPDSLALREMRLALYEGHPRGRRATEKTVDAVTLDDVKDLHAQLIGSSSWVIGAVGDFSAEELAAGIERRFGKLGAARSERFKKLDPPAKPVPKMVIVKKKLPQTTLLWAGFGPGIMSPERAPMELADFVLGGGGFVSRLTKKVRIEKGLAYSVGSFYTPVENFGIVGAQASTSTDKAVEVWNLIGAEISRAGKTPFNPAEVAEAAKTEQSRYIFRFRDPADQVVERMGLELKGLPHDLVERYYRELAAVTPERVSEAAARAYRPEEGVWIIVGDVSAADPAFVGPWKIVEVTGR